MREALRETDFRDIGEPRRGKVRDIYNLGDRLLIVATDRLSAFDVVLPTGIPDKGRILTELSIFWFKEMEDIIENHLIETDAEKFPAPLMQYAHILKGRSMLVKKTDVIPIECVVRGYLAGSGWKDYKESGSICGIKLPLNLIESEKLPEPIFTPTTKAEEGHDMAITEKQLIEIIGEGLAKQLKNLSLAIYNKACRIAESKGIIIADTKFEFGTINDMII